MTYEDIVILMRKDLGACWFGFACPFDLTLSFHVVRIENKELETSICGTANSVVKEISTQEGKRFLMERALFYSFVGSGL